MANPVLRATVQFIDQASSTLSRITNAQNALNSAVLAGNTAAQKSGAIVQRTTQQLGPQIAALRSATAQAEANARATDKQRISMLGMLRVMAFFAVNLQIIRTLTAPFTFLRGAISSATDFQFELQQINVLLRLEKSELQEVGRQVRILGGEFGREFSDINAALKQVASTIDVLNVGPLTEQAAALEVVRQATRAAVTDNADLVETTNALISVLAALQIPVTETESLMKLLFATVDVGNTSFGELGREIGTFAATLSVIIPRDAEKANKFLQETFTLFAALTTVFPTAEAATGLNRFFISFIDQSKGQVAAIRELQQLTGADLSLANLIQSGPVSFTQELATAFGQEGPLKNIVEGQLDPDLFTDEQLSALVQASSAKAASAIFPNIRALRPALLFAQQGFVSQANVGILDSIKEFETAQREALDNFQVSLQRVQRTIDSLKISLGTPIINALSEALTPLADRLNEIVNAEGFDELSAGEKIKRVLDTITDTMNEWWDTKGKDQVSGFITEFVLILVDVLETVIVGNADKFAAIGGSIARAVLSGMSKGFIGGVTDPVNNPLLLTAAFRASGLFGGGVGGLARSFGAAVAGQSIAQGGSPLDALFGLAPFLLFSGLGKGKGGGPVGSAVTGGLTRTQALLYGGAAGLTNPNLGGRLRTVNKGPGGFTALTGAQKLRNRALGIPAAANLRNLNFLSLLLGAGLIAGADGNSLSVGAGLGLTARSLTPVVGGAVAGVGASALFAGLIPKDTLIDTNRAFNQFSAAAGLSFDESRAIANSPFFTEAFDFTQGGVGGFTGPNRTPTGFKLTDAGRGSIFAAGGNITKGTADILRSFGAPEVITNNADVFVQAAINAGITDPSQFMAFLALSTATIKGESGFRPGEVGDLNLDPNGSVGLLQLFFGKTGQGRLSGFTPEQLQDPTRNLQVGLPAIARNFASGVGGTLVVNGVEISANDPNIFAFISRAAGHPGVGASGITFANQIQSDTLGFLNAADIQSTFLSIENGGTSSSVAGLQINVSGDMNLTLSSADILDELLSGAAQAVDESSAGVTTAAATP